MKPRSQNLPPLPGVPVAEAYPLRWRGRQQGPWPVAAIEEKLAAGEIGLLHEILVGNRWLTLREFLAQQAADRAAAEQARQEAERADEAARQQAKAEEAEAARLRAVEIEEQRLQEIKRQNDLIEQHQRRDGAGPMPEQASLSGGLPYVRKSRGIYIALGIFLGGLGIHNFYAGYYGRGIGQLALGLLAMVFLLPALPLLVWVVVELFVIKQDSNRVPFQ